MQFTTLFLTAAIAGSALAGSPDAWGPPAPPPAYGHGGSWPVTSAVSVAPPPPYVTPAPPKPTVSAHSLPPYKSNSWAYSSKKVSSASAYSSASKPVGPIGGSSTATTAPIATSTGGANSLAQNGVAALAFLGAAAAFAL